MTTLFVITFTLLLVGGHINLHQRDDHILCYRLQFQVDIDDIDDPTLTDLIYIKKGFLNDEQCQTDY